LITRWPGYESAKYGPYYKAYGYTILEAVIKSELEQEIIKTRHKQAIHCVKYSVYAAPNFFSADFWCTHIWRRLAAAEDILYLAESI